MNESDESQSWPKATITPRSSSTYSATVQRLNFYSGRTQPSQLSNSANATLTQQPAPSLFPDEESFANSRDF